MTAIQKSLLPVNNGFNIKTFTEDGGHINRKPIPEIELFSIVSPIANRSYNFDFGVIGFDLIALSLWGYKSSGINNNDGLEIKILDRNNQALLWDLDLAGNKNTLGSAFFYEFPFLCVSTSHLVRITSSVGLDNLIIFGEKGKLNQPISPTF